VIVSEQLAVIDLGSNSFQMVVARSDQGQLNVVDRLREPVGLAGGLDADGKIDAATKERALACLSRMGERLREVPTTAVRVVGTNTLRRAKNSRQFVHAAEAVLGHPVELISGKEEARLIYQGVARNLPEFPRRRLVVDVGGGSTELILGHGDQPIERDSIQVGHLRWAVQFFGGKATLKSFRKAETRARLELEGLKRRYRDLGWEIVVGSSGTARAIDAIVASAGWVERGVTRESLNKLTDLIVEARTPGGLIALNLPGLSADRAQVIAGGVAILKAVFDTLKIDEMTASQSAMREGVLYDLIGRRAQNDARDVTIEALQRRYSIDQAHAARIERTALTLFHQVATPWGLQRLEGQRFLSWAALLHEIGLSVNHSGYHKHSAYLIKNGDMPGFSRDDQEMLSAIVSGHRRKLTTDKLALYIGPARLPVSLKLATVLRLAVRLHRTRSSRSLPDIILEAEGTSLAMSFPPGWLDENPLKRADLEDEASVLVASGTQLTLR
jgi:exopolyphosphatase / guanosine-5'-triphosphate,3'-diphosphate pyrophosphatase